MGEPKIYADLTFFINLVMDFLILWAAGRMAGLKLVFSRIAGAAIIGGIYAVGNLFPVSSVLYSLPIKILVSCLLIFLGLRPQGWKEIKKTLFYFYAISFAAAGATVAAFYLRGRGNVNDLSYAWLPGGIVCIVAIGIYGGRYIESAVIPGLLQYMVEIRFDEAAICSGRGFLDTGNNLKDPLTHRPVIIAEYGLLREILPDDLCQVLETTDDSGTYIDALALTEWAHRMCLLPFSSVGEKNGLLVGLRADEIIVNDGKKGIVQHNVIIGIYKDVLSVNGDYQLLLPMDIFQKA